MSKLPIGVQSFEDLRRNSYLYVDKTMCISRLIESGKVYFLSRPRRFGKSLFISTLEAYFRGQKELFDGLMIADQESRKPEDQQWIEYPVLKFSLSGGEYQNEAGLANSLKFVFFTGVTKFSKVSIFSDLNQLRDISLSNEFSGICGITEEEMMESFRQEISDLALQNEMTEEECLDQLRFMYDGYCFSRSGVKVYNPFSLLNAFADRQLRSYWFSTGTPAFPNHEVRNGFVDSIFPYYFNRKSEEM